MSIGMEGCGPNPRTYSKAEYDALQAECERLCSELAAIKAQETTINKQLTVKRDTDYGCA